MVNNIRFVIVISRDFIPTPDPLYTDFGTLFMIPSSQKVFHKIIVHVYFIN